MIKTRRIMNLRAKSLKMKMTGLTNAHRIIMIKDKPAKLIFSEEMVTTQQAIIFY